MNYEYKSPEFETSNKDLLIGYCIALSGALGSTVILRKLAAGLVSSATGNKILILNTVIAQIASITGHFLSTSAMRKSEADNGIKVFSDPNLKYEVGTCKVSARKAILQTIASRFVMSFAMISGPTIIMLGLNLMGVRPMSLLGKKIFEVGVITASLLFAYPLSAAIYHPTSKICAT